MVRSWAREAPVNPLEERNLLSAQAVSRWAGLPIGWVEAVPELSGSCETAGHTLLAMIDSGRAHAEFHYGSRSIARELGAGAIGLFTPGGHADISRWRCAGVRRIMLQFDQRQFDDAVLSEQLARMPLRPEIEFHDDGLAAVLRSMVREVADGCPSGALFAESLSIGVAMHLQQRAARRYALGRERGKLSAAQSRRVQELVRARLGHALSIGELAQAAGFSRTQFVRLFKNTFERTPYQYILDTRLQYAHELVLASALPLADIAEAAGFSSQSHMTTAFARAFGATPGELRRAAGI
jgi:AraC family transcriptional regulator